MKKNSKLKPNHKLFLRIYIYYGFILAIFAFLIGCIFTKLYSDSSMESYREKLEIQAKTISSRLSEYVINEDYQEGLYYLQVLQETQASQNVLLNNDILVIANPEAGKPLNKKLQTITAEEAKLSSTAKKVLDNAFQDKMKYGTSFLKLYDVSMLTIGAPIHDAAGRVVGAVLINSPVEVQRNVANSSKYFMFLSTFIALIISFIIVFLFARKLSTPISKMRVTALSLAEGNYGTRTNLNMKDELGDLAGAIDTLADRLAENEKERKNMEQMRLDFFANVSHELRTPITVVRAYTESLIDGVVTDDEKKQQFYTRMLTECKSMERLVGDLLVLSKMQNPDFKIEAEPINLLQVFEDVLRSAGAIAAQKHITIDFKKDENDFYIMGDYDRIRQMFLVILDNAVKFSPENSVIHISMENKQQLTISIKDEGIGISEEELPNIFDKFYKSKLRQNAKGSGLGLAIAKQIALKHQGDIQVYSEVSKGTEFVFTLRALEKEEIK